MSREEKRRAKKDVEIRGQISYFLTTEGYTKKELAKSLGMSLSTLYNKLNHPNTFTLGEVRDLMLILKLDESQVLAII